MKCYLCSQGLTAEEGDGLHHCDEQISGTIGHIRLVFFLPDDERVIKHLFNIYNSLTIYYDHFNVIVM